MVVSAHAVVLARELDCRLGRLRPGARQVAPVQVTRAGGGKSFRELDRSLGREEDRAGTRDFPRLGRIRLDDVLAAVPERSLPHGRAEIEVAVAANVREPAALALDEHTKHVPVDEIDQRALVDPQVIERSVLRRSGHQASQM
jgi:hypothetical protein